ncbi:helix-turn-helix transcriptional regulator [Primorskyibacter aestuariivivens]|uniref:helix-turn-helix domain-containing protein n=1 Tax=Primorskyibacter aestuariivivens TaxID=1888912 RepID=UPI0023015DFD|nr:helix-turn-helix transcriptional regulator [Primorskyibacter aestuariivivens]MDA7426893.1 helix-turn-helix transcriptional regulator [Primorskyibacter aestuariivivens]
MPQDPLRDRLQSLIEAQGRKPAELGAAIGIDESALTGFLDGSTPEGPSFATMSRLARELGVSLSYFDEQEGDFEIASARDIDQQASRLLTDVFRTARAKMLAQGSRPTMDCIVAWWQETGGKLENCETLLPYVDLVSASGQDGAPEVTHIGPLGLSAETLKSNDASKLQTFIEKLNDADMNELRTTIATVSRIGVGMVTPQSRIVPATRISDSFRVDFVRLMLPVTDKKGAPYVLNFSTLLSVSSPRKYSGDRV